MRNRHGKSEEDGENGWIEIKKPEKKKSGDLLDFTKKRNCPIFMFLLYPLNYPLYYFSLFIFLLFILILFYHYNY